MTTTINNEHKKLNCPPLRFPEFTEEWEKVKLGDKCNLLCGYAFEGEDIVEQGTYLLMRGVNITEGTIRHSSEIDRYYSGSVEKLDKYKLTAGDLVIGMDGSKVGKNSAIVSLYEEGSYLVQRVCRIKSSIGNNYILQFVNNAKFHRYVDTVKTSSAIPHISLKDIQNFRISIPPTQNETDKIAKLFTLLEERIATQNKAIEKLESLIKGLSKRLFSQAQTFSFLYEYDSNITAGKDASSKELGEIPLYGSTGIIGRVATASHNEPLVLVARVGSIGSVQYVNGYCSVSDNTLIIHGQEHSRYIYHFLKTFNFSKIASGTTQPLITASALKLVMIPKFDSLMQSRITTLLDCLNNRIVTETSILCDLKVQKQHLLRQMFT